MLSKHSSTWAPYFWTLVSRLSPAQCSKHPVPCLCVLRALYCRTCGTPGFHLPTFLTSGKHMQAAFILSRNSDDCSHDFISPLAFLLQQQLPLPVSPQTWHCFSCFSLCRQPWTLCCGNWVCPIHICQHLVHILSMMTFYHNWIPWCGISSPRRPKTSSLHCSWSDCSHSTWPEISTQ